MKKDKSNKPPSSLIERAVERLLNDEKEEQQSFEKPSNIIQFDSSRSEKIVVPEDSKRKKVK